MGLFFLRSWQNDSKFHLKNKCVRMFKIFSLRKTWTAPKEKSWHHPRIFRHKWAECLALLQDRSPRPVCAALKAAAYFYMQPAYSFLSKWPLEAEQLPQKGGLRSQMYAEPLTGMGESCRHREQTSGRKSSNAHWDSSQFPVGKEGAVSRWRGTYWTQFLGFMLSIKDFQET